MNANDLLNAMGEIGGRHLVPALERLDARATPRRGARLRRALLPAALAAALLLSAFTAAMAASPGFRAGVLTFFHLGPAEAVPDPASAPAGGTPALSQAAIAGTVPARYIRAEDPVNGLGGDLFCQYAWDDALQANWPSAFWTIRDGALVPADVAPERREVAVEWQGDTYRAVFDWLVWEGEARVTDFLSRTGASAGEGLELNLDVAALPGCAGKVLLTLRLDTQMSGSCWYMLYDLASGRAEDPLAGTEAARFTRADRLHDALWARDLSGAILTCGWPATGDTFYYLDLGTGALTDLSEATGVDVDGAVFADDSTLLLWQFGEGAGVPAAACWAYTPASGQLIQTLPPTPRLNPDAGAAGVRLLGDHVPCCVVVDGDGGTRIVDLRTGAATLVESFAFDAAGDVAASPGGDKLLYYVSGTDGQLRRLGVLDLSAGRFLAFDRDVPAAARESVFWLDENRVAVRCSAGDGENGPQGLYLYEF